MRVPRANLQVPMNKSVYDALKRRAYELGFDSPQAYVRVWATAEAENRILSFGDLPSGSSAGWARNKLREQSEQIAEEVRREKLMRYHAEIDFDELTEDID